MTHISIIHEQQRTLVKEKKTQFPMLQINITKLKVNLQNIKCQL